MLEPAQYLYSYHVKLFSLMISVPQTPSRGQANENSDGKLCALTPGGQFSNFCTECMC